MVILKLKQKFYCRKSPIFLKDVDVEKVLVSKRIFFGEKRYQYFIGSIYDDYKVKPLHIMLPKANMYVKSYDEQNKCIYVLIEDDWRWWLLEKNNII